MITYQDSAEAVTAAQLTGFFAGWPNPPSPENHLRILRGSDFVLLARDEKTGHIVGFITAITDGVSVAYLPHLEVLTEYQDRALGRSWYAGCSRGFPISTGLICFAIRRYSPSMSGSASDE
jgi:hypothetical protein